MDPSDYPAGKSPRRELQGPRPTPLKVRKDSHKIRKPPVAPGQTSQQLPQHRPPVIIYTVSPKIIHTDPGDFMTLVQRLTGSSNLSSSSYSEVDSSELLSPAARFASVEKTKSPKWKNTQQDSNQDVTMVDGEMEMNAGIDRSSLFPGILSPGPSSLPPIPPNFFSPPSDPNPTSFFYDLSPAMQGNKYLENSYLPSPSHFFSPHVSPTTPSLDLFNNFFDM